MLQSTIAYVTSQGVVPRQLPKGPHGLSRETVRASQRHRIIDATLEAVGRHGYGSATVTHITAAAGVSRSAFYEQFRDKRDAFLTAYEVFTSGFFEELAATSLDAPSPLEGIEASVRLLVDYGRERPVAARAAVLEIYAAGEPGLRRREAALQLAELAFDKTASWLRRVDPTLPPVAAGISRAIIAASFELAAQAVRIPDEEHLEPMREAVLNIWLLGLTGQSRAAALRPEAAHQPAS